MAVDFDALQALIDRMYLGDKQAIHEGLIHPGALLRINGILSMMELEISDSDLVDQVKAMVDDSVEVDCIPVGEYAQGLLDIYGLSKYRGEHQLIYELINEYKKAS